MIVTRQGAGIYFPHALPVSSSRPLTPPRSLKEIHCPLLSQLPPSSRVGKTIFHKKEQTNFLSFCPLSRPKALFIAIRCVIPASTVNTWTLFDREKKKKPEWASIRPYFHKHTKCDVLCHSQHLTSCLLLHSM